MSIDKNKKTHAPMRGNRGGHGVVMAGEKIGRASCRERV